MTIRKGTDETPRDTLVRLIADLPREHKGPAGLGWRLGLIDGAQRVLHKIGQAADDIRKGGVHVLRWPRWDELQGRRELDHEPCCRRCNNCSRCIHAEAWRKRGGRPYLGVQREAEPAKRPS